MWKGSSSVLPTQVNKQFIILLTASVNSAYLYKHHNCEPYKRFILSSSKIHGNLTFSLAGGGWSKSATVITEIPANAFSGIIKNISPNLESISVHKYLYTKESSSIIKNFASDNLFLKMALDLSFIPSNYVPGLIIQNCNEWLFQLYLLLIVL